MRKSMVIVLHSIREPSKVHIQFVDKGQSIEVRVYTRAAHSKSARRLYRIVNDLIVENRMRMTATSTSIGWATVSTEDW